MSFIEQVHFYACKRYICVPKYVANIAVNYDCGRVPELINIVKRVLK